MAKMTDTEKLNLLIRDDPEISGKMYARMKMHINEATVVDAVPVVHGRWESNRWEYVCSCCQTPFTDELPWITHPDCRMPNYCPNCGADMRGVEDGK